jgi:hypothetical protein
MQWMRWALVGGVLVAGAGGLRDAAGASAQTQRPGQEIPLLEIDSNFQLIGARSTLTLVHHGERRQLGVLTQSVGQSFTGVYNFRRTESGPIVASLDWVILTADPGRKIDLKQGASGAQLGRIRQRAIFSIGTGLDVYAPNDDKVGYVDEQVGRNLQNALLPRILHNKYYVFNRYSYRQQGGRKVRQTEEPYHFLSGEIPTFGPCGLFARPGGAPVLAVRGDWWVSRHIFDLRYGGNNHRNPSGYLGAFLTGLIYFDEWRRLTGVDLPLGTTASASPAPNTLVLAPQSPESVTLLNVPGSH